MEYGVELIYELYKYRRGQSVKRLSKRIIEIIEGRKREIDEAKQSGKKSEWGSWNAGIDAVLLHALKVGDKLRVKKMIRQYF